MAVNLRHGITPKNFLGMESGPETEPHEMIFRFTRAKIAANILEEDFGTGEGVG
jgi:hypothetical protein